MSCLARSALLSVLLGCSVAGSARACDVSAGYVEAYAAPGAFAWSAPCCVPCWDPCQSYVLPADCAPGIAYATPKAAPPSAGPVVPSNPSGPPMKRVPEVSESQSYYRGPGVAFAANNGEERLPVRFWNLANRDVSVRVAGRTYTLPRGERLNLDLGRQFVWQVEGGELENERIPATEKGLEIVFRR